MWWLRHACPGSDKDALTGDLIERFHEGQTRGWFWRQVLIAFIVGVLGEIRRHWPYFGYAIGGFVLEGFFWNAHALGSVPKWLHWNELPWPWSQLASELSRPALLALAALPVLAAGLLIERSFRWVHLVRTAVITLALIAFGHFSFDIFPWLLRPLIIPVIVQMVLVFSAFLVAAWLGCVTPGHADEFESRPVTTD
jgi:hypothetical protein